MTISAASLGGGGGGVDSIQKGSWAFTSGSTTNITINAVDISKSIVILSTATASATTSSAGNSGRQISYQNGYPESWGYGYGYGYANDASVGGELTSSTNLYLKAGSMVAAGSAGTCYWQVITYA